MDKTSIEQDLLLYPLYASRLDILLFNSYRVQDVPFIPRWLLRNSPQQVCGKLSGWVAALLATLDCLAALLLVTLVGGFFCIFLEKTCFKKGFQCWLLSFSSGWFPQETRKSMMPSCQEELCETHLGYPKWPEEMTLFPMVGWLDGYRSVLHQLHKYWMWCTGYIHYIYTYIYILFNICNSNYTCMYSFRWHENIYLII